MPAHRPQAKDAAPLHAPPRAQSVLPLSAGPLSAGPFVVGLVAAQAWADMAACSARFVQDRLCHDLKTQQAMLFCASLQDLRQVQSDFFSAAQDQYAAHVVMLLGLIGNVAASGLTPTTTARHYDDVPL